MVLVQKWPYFQLLFLGNIAQENVFNDFLERKNAFLGYRNKKFKSRKIDFFPKGLTHGFGPKMVIFGSKAWFNPFKKNGHFSSLKLLVFIA